MKNKKGFTLVEIIVVISLLALLSIILVISLNKVQKNSKENSWNKLVERIKSAADVYLEKSPEYIKNVYYEAGVSYLSVNTLITEGLIDEEHLVDERDNKSILEKEEKYQYVKAYLNEDLALEYMYPAETSSYIKIYPRSLTIGVGVATNLLKEKEVYLCNKDNVCGNNSSIEVYDGTTKITNPSEYIFNEVGTKTIKYVYKEIETYREYNVIPTDYECNLRINNGDLYTNNRSVNIEIIGSEISKYKLTMTKDDNKNPKSYQNSDTLNLTSGDGTKEVYLYCYSAYGVMKEAQSSIILDETDPEVRKNIVTTSLGAKLSDNLSAPEFYELTTTDEKPSTWKTTTSCTINSEQERTCSDIKVCNISNTGTYYIWTKDYAGNTARVQSKCQSNSTCSSGTLSNGSCVKAATPSTDYSCPYGYTSSGYGSSMSCSKSSRVSCRVNTSTTTTCTKYYKTCSCTCKFRSLLVPDAPCSFKDSVRGTRYANTNSCSSACRQHEETMDGDWTYCQTVSGSCTENDTCVPGYSGTTTTYSCPYGCEKSGSGSNTTCSKYDTIETDPNETTTYSCSADWIRRGTSCYKDPTTTYEWN